MTEAFDGKTVTGRRVPDPMIDKKAPPPGSLDWKTIASDKALAGTDGVDCKRVTGQRWELIDDPGV